MKLQSLISLYNFKLLRQLRGSLKGKEILNNLGFFNKIIHRQNSYAPKFVLHEQSKPVYIWPKLHGVQSAKVLTVQSEIKKIMLIIKKNLI